MKSADFVVVGAGIIGLSIARALRQTYPDASVAILEKEAAVGIHASGRNSGVLHAGFYYTADSLKARFTKQGNERLQEYCRERRLPLNVCGKLVVARDVFEIESLRELKRRGDRNGIIIEWIDEKQAREIEPRAKTADFALWSPTTASVDPSRVVESMALDAKALGIAFVHGVRVCGWRNHELHTQNGKYGAGYVINAAGLYADRIARLFGFSQHYRILPFKGLYLYSDERAGALRTNIYPVPDLRNPFLGVHFTVTVDGRIKIGPTAIPAFWRENYGGFGNFHMGEMFDVLWRELRLFLRSEFGFARLAFNEMKKYSRRHMVSLAQTLASGVELRNFRRWGQPGIRAQLVDVRSNHLVMDFALEGDDRSMHVLNAVSPAFTCALPFADHVVREIRQRLGEPIGRHKANAVTGAT